MSMIDDTSRMSNVNVEWEMTKAVVSCLAMQSFNSSTQPAAQYCATAAIQKPLCFLNCQRIGFLLVKFAGLFTKNLFTVTRKCLFHIIPHNQLRP